MSPGYRMEELRLLPSQKNVRLLQSLYFLPVPVGISMTAEYPSEHPICLLISVCDDLKA